jgi:2-methylcitrate dehydratase PrpD
MYKYADAGWCAQVGTSAALLAALGSTGFVNILDGENAFWRLYGSPSHDDQALMNGLGSDWQILNTTYKPWPCCRWIHHPLTAFSRLRQQHGLQPDEISKVVVRANPLALAEMFKEQQPADPLSAEFSHAHAIAVAAYDVPPGPRWYAPETMQAEHIRDFRRRVEVEPEPRSANIAEWMGGGQWRGIPGGVDVYARGEVFRATADLSLGDPWSEETLLADQDLLEKFRVMVGLDRSRPDGVIAEQAEKAITAIGAIESSETLAELADPLSELATAIAVRSKS